MSLSLQGRRCAKVELTEQVVGWTAKRDEPRDTVSRKTGVFLTRHHNEARLTQRVRICSGIQDCLVSFTLGHTRPTRAGRRARSGLFFSSCILFLFLQSQPAHSRFRLQTVSVPHSLYALPFRHHLCRVTRTRSSSLACLASLVRNPCPALQSAKDLGLCRRRAWDRYIRLKHPVRSTRRRTVRAKHLHRLL